MFSAFFNAPITFGVDLFVWIVCFLAACGAAAIVINVLSEAASGKKNAQEQED